MKSALIFISLVSVILISCQKIFFSGEEETREITLGDFHAVKISGIYNVVLTQDYENRLVITGKNDINSIDAMVIDDTLIIENHKSIPFNTEKNNLTLHLSSLDYLVTYDPVNISNTDTLKGERILYDAIGEISQVTMTVDCDLLQVVNSANTLGTFYFYGKAVNCSFFNRYGCTIFAGGLLCRFAEITNESIGDVYINASENIRAYIWGPGNIYYYGIPEIEVVEQKGKGTIIKLN